MITLHIFTEEASAKNVFDILLPQVLPKNAFFRVYPHQGKQDLEKALRKTIPSISKTPGARILITRDQDSGDCKELKQNIINLIDNNCSCPYLIRIVCRELESWFLGDLHAIQKTYPRFKADNYFGRQELKHVDKIVSPNKKLLSIIPEFSDWQNLPKLEVSENISNHLNLNINTSESFNQTISGIKRLLDSDENI